METRTTIPDRHLTLNTLFAIYDFLEREGFAGQARILEYLNFVFT
jgi:hypothetical protein